MMWRLITLGTLVAGTLLVPNGSTGDGSAPHAPAQSSYVLRASVMGGAGTPTQASGFRQNGTLAQATPVSVVAGSGNRLYAGFWRAWVKGTVTGIEEGSSPSFINRLHQNYPNPFRLTTSIEYTVAQASPVEVTVFNIQGQQVRRLVNELKPPGRHRVTWNGFGDQGAQMAQGVYFCRLRIDAFTEVRKMVILK